MTGATFELEDDIGDVIDKALHHSGQRVEEVSERAGVCSQRIQDALDYRSDLSCAELRRLASALGLNEVGFCALGRGRYPRAELPALSFTLHVLALPFGVGVTNAYIASAPGEEQGVLFDFGPSWRSLQMAWPQEVRSLAGAFLTHAEAEHTGGLAETLRSYRLSSYRGPPAKRFTSIPMVEGESWTGAGLRVNVFHTPGHAAAHYAYLVEREGSESPGALIAGDLLFAGSIGGGYFSSKRAVSEVRRLLSQLPPATLVAPGHGPLTTIASERTYNPFFV